MAKARAVKTAGAALAKTHRPAVADSAPMRGADGLENLVAGLGTDRDKRSYSTYGYTRVLNRIELDAAYRGSWLVKRIIDSIADDMTREGWEVSFDSDNPDDRLAIERAEEHFQIHDKINSALKWARLYGGSRIVIGIKGQDLSMPLDLETIKQGSLQFLHVLDRHRLVPDPILCRDMDSPNFGKPDFYRPAESSVRIHHSRVLCFDGAELPYFQWQSNGYWHDSELQHVMETIKDHDHTTGCIATMMFEANVDVVISENLHQTIAQKDGEELVRKRYRLAALMKSVNRMLLLDGKETYEKRTTSFANLPEVVNSFRVAVCGAADIPMTRLFGQSPGGMNSTGDGDIRNYYDMIAAKQKSDLRPPLFYLYQIIARSALGLMPDDFLLKFRQLWQVSATEQADITLKNAQADQIYLQEGVLHEANIGRELKDRGTYPTLTDEDIDMLQELVDEPPKEPEIVPIDEAPTISTPDEIEPATAIEAAANPVQ